MRIGIALIFGFSMLASLGVAQELPLWRLTNPLAAQSIPVYGAAMSPFMLSMPMKTVENTPINATDDAAQQMRQNQVAIERVQQMIAAPSALRPQLLSPAKALTNGPQGYRVLMSGQWIGVGDSIPVRYTIHPDIRTGLQQIQQFDADQAHKLAQQIETKQRRLEAQQAKIASINAKDHQLTVEGPMGNIVLPLNLLK